MTKPKKSAKRRREKRQQVSSYSFEFRLKVVKLFLEEGYSSLMLTEELGVGKSTIGTWVRNYRQFGEDGLKSKLKPSTGTRVPPQVKKTIVDIKKDHPDFGSRRITDVLKRFFLIKTSPKTVGKTLAAEGLTSKPQKKTRKNPGKPRFFERSRPNQLWQSDIMTFRLAGKNAYLIGYIDDYSRYITSLGLFRSQTASNVIETYRTGIAEYGVPKEMLTDNGRQYVNWRGTTRFEKELKKDRVKHIRSRPHHPMTLGKIERFWKTILNEFLNRAQFGSYEEAQDRVAFWIKYYNYKRPHQGIGGLCPADRFFEIQHALKKTLEQGIEENTLELALRGKPADPFYMVGRMGDQSVVIRAEKGKVKMLVDDATDSNEKELVYDMRKDIKNEESKENPQGLRSSGKDRGGTVNLDGMPYGNTGLPGYVGELGNPGQLAESGDGRHADSVESFESRAQGDPQLSPCAAHGEKAQWKQGQTSRSPEKDPERQERKTAVTEAVLYEQIPTSQETGGNHHEGQLRPDDGRSGSPGIERLPEDLLQMGEERLIRFIRQCYGSAGGTSGSNGGQRAGDSEAATGAGDEGERAARAANVPEGSSVGHQAWLREPGKKKIKPSEERSWRSKG